MDSDVNLISTADGNVYKGFYKGLVEHIFYHSTTIKRLLPLNAAILNWTVNQLAMRDEKVIILVTWNLRFKIFSFSLFSVIFGFFFWH